MKNKKFISVRLKTIILRKLKSEERFKIKSEIYVKKYICHFFSLPKYLAIELHVKKWAKIGTLPKKRQMMLQGLKYFCALSFQFKLALIRWKLYLGGCRNCGTISPSVDDRAPCVGVLLDNLLANIEMRYPY